MREYAAQRLELLQAFAENAAVWIAARRASEQLDAQVAATDHDGTDWNRIVAAHIGNA